MRYIVSRYPGSVEDLGQAELVPVSVGSPLQDRARFRVDVK